MTRYRYLFPLGVGLAFAAGFHTHHLLPETPLSHTQTKREGPSHSPYPVLNRQASGRGFDQRVHGANHRDGALNAAILERVHNAAKTQTKPTGGDLDKERVTRHADGLRVLLDLSARQVRDIEDYFTNDPDGSSPEERAAALTSILDAGQLEMYRRHQLGERARRIEDHAHAELRSFSKKFELTEKQKDRLFGVFVRFHREFHPAMRTSGAGPSANMNSAPDRERAVMQILTKEQGGRYQRGLDRWRNITTDDVERPAIGSTSSTKL